jgi:DNA-binding NarL/FixJ family response regulator
MEKRESRLLKLTPREREVLQMIVTGANNREIAQALYIAEGTVRNYVSKILSILNVRSRTQAVLVANNSVNYES